MYIFIYIDLPLQIPINHIQEKRKGKQRILLQQMFHKKNRVKSFYLVWKLRVLMQKAKTKAKKTAKPTSTAATGPMKSDS